MKWSITFLKKVAVIRLKITGRMDAESFGKMVRDMMEHSRRHRADRFLLDFRKAKLTMSFLDIYEAPKVIEKHGSDRRKRVAVLMSKASPRKEEARFFETVLQNQGFPMYVFTDVAGAMKWLTSTR